MEIYANSANRTIYLEVPIIANGNTMEVTVYDGDDLVHTASVVTYVNGRYETALPFSLAQNEKSYQVNWRFAYTENSQVYEYDNYTEVDVITPILTLSEINAIVKDDVDWTTEELTRLERAVRFIIQAHTGQTFGKYIGSKYVTGSGEANLRLPSRLISMNRINGNAYWADSLALRGGGWFLQSRVWGIPTVRADNDGWHENPWSNKVPIVAPYSKNTHVFIKHAEYEIDGVWGWNFVPEQVKEAARLLINDYACADANYRDRFLTSMTAADWRIQFHEGAFTNTGNVRANQLLAEFVLRRGWVVV